LIAFFRASHPDHIVQRKSEEVKQIGGNEDVKKIKTLISIISVFVDAFIVA